MKLNKVVIIPTGDEVASGIIFDSNSLMLTEKIVKKFPPCEIYRLSPAKDRKKEIIEALNRAVGFNPDLIILTGGTGGGRKFSLNLAPDLTHVVLSKLLSPKAEREIYGGNGHLWCKIVCGYYNSILVVSLPGPETEACRTFEIALNGIIQRSPLDKIVNSMADGLSQLYTDL
jgi:hypothetical protein